LLSVDDRRSVGFGRKSSQKTRRRGEGDGAVKNRLREDEIRQNRTTIDEACIKIPKETGGRYSEGGQARGDPMTWNEVNSAQQCVSEKTKKEKTWTS